jgi:hypothetical protein
MRKMLLSNVDVSKYTSYAASVREEFVCNQVNISKVIIAISMASYSSS